jgi:hypothetical protein
LSVNQLHDLERAGAGSRVCPVGPEALCRPEATIRRQGARSVTEELLTQNGLGDDARLALLGKMTHLYEITPWMRPSDRAAQQLGEELIVATGQCVPSGITECVNRAFQYLDGWYK